MIFDLTHSKPLSLVIWEEGASAAEIQRGVNRRVDIKSYLNIIRSSKIEGGESASRVVVVKEYGWGGIRKISQGWFYNHKEVRS